MAIIIDGNGRVYGLGDPVTENDATRRKFIHDAMAVPVVKMSLSSSQSVPSSTIAVAQWDVVDYDSHGMANAPDIVVQQDGLYRISGFQRWAGTSGEGIRIVAVTINGTQESLDARNPGTATGYGTFLHTTMLEQGDIITLELWQTSGSSLSFQVGVNSPYIAVEYLRGVV